MKLGRRDFFIAAGGIGAAAILGGGATWYMLQDDDAPKGASSRIDLLTGLVRTAPPWRPDDIQQFAMLTITGGMPRKSSFAIRLFDLAGTPSTTSLRPRGSLTNLVTGEATEQLRFTATEDGGGWEVEQDRISSEGWWQLSLDVDGAQAIWTFLMPDPNLTGFDTPPVIESEPDAQAMLAGVLDNLTQSTSLRWWEWLSGGNGAIILAEFAVTTPESNGLLPGFESNSLMAGRIPPDGGAPSFRAENPRTVTVGDQSVKIINGGTPEVGQPVQYLPIDQYDTTYAGHDGVRFGIAADIGGKACQLISFHLPSAVEAWFAFWVETETLTLRELFMLSVNHYMHWVYYDINEPFELKLE